MTVIAEAPRTSAVARLREAWRRMRKLDMECVACRRIRPKDGGVWDHHMPSPLAGYVSMPTCRECRQRRAVYPQQAAWFLSEICHLEPGQIPDNRLRDWLLTAIHIDGWRDGDRSGSPVHVFQSGAYVPLRDWIGSDGHIAADGEWRAEVVARQSSRAAATI